jgi:hypothetical protein
MELRGPCSYSKTLGFRNIANPEIVDACIEVDGIVTPLQENWLSIEHGDGALYVWHNYKYYNSNATVLTGRWYDVTLPLDTFKNMKKFMFRRTIPNYEGGPAIVRIFFTETIVGLLKEL